MSIHLANNPLLSGTYMGYKQGGDEGSETRGLELPIYSQLPSYRITSVMHSHIQSQAISILHSICQIHEIPSNSTLSNCNRLKPHSSQSTNYSTYIMYIYYKFCIGMIKFALETKKPKGDNRDFLSFRARLNFFLWRQLSLIFAYVFGILNWSEWKLILELYSGK